VGEAGALNPLNRKVAFIDDVWGNPARQAIWFARVNAIKTGRAKQYRHHPLEERALFLASANRQALLTGGSHG
jgi:hypothetical protein